MAKRPKDDVAEWKGRLTAVMEERKDVEQQWKLSRDQYEDTLVNSADIDKNKRIRVNLAFPTVKVLVRAACSSDPYIYITGVRPQDEASGEILQYLENRLWRIQKRKKVLRQIVLDAILLKVGYGLSHIRKDPLTGKPDVYLTRVSPYQLWLERGATSVNDAYYIFREVLMPRVEAQAKWPKVKFPTHDKNELKRALTFGQPPESTLKGEGDDTDRVAIYEVHDQLKREVSYISLYHNKYLIEPRPNPYPFETNFTELIFNEIIDEHYGLGDLEPVAVQQEELDRVRSAMLKHTKRFNRKYAIQEEEYKEDRLKDLESGEDGAIVKMQDIDNIKPIEDARMSSDIYNYAEIIRGDHREVTGVNEYLNAGRISGTKTAYETEQIMSGARVRLGEKPDLTGDFCEDVAAKDIDMMKKIYPVPQIVKYIGPDQQEIWRYVQQWELQGQHYVVIHAGSTQPKDETANFQRGLLLYQTFANDPEVDHKALLQEVMNLMNIKNKARLLGIPMQASMPGDQGQSLQAMPYGMNPASRSIPDFNKMRSALPGGGQTSR